jgi:hypothetical protein
MFGYSIVLKLRTECQKDGSDYRKCNCYGAGKLWFEQLLP